MRYRVLAVLLFGISASLTLSLIRGQDRTPPMPIIITGGIPKSEPQPLGGSAPPGVPMPVAGADSPNPSAAVPVSRPTPRDLSHLTPLQQQMLLVSQRGADWLYRMNGEKGRFMPGYVPALKQEMEGDHYLRQAGAAGALARAAHFTGEEGYRARATQAVLVLLDDTMIDPGDATSRYTIMPPIAVDRMSSAAALVLAICELPSVEKDLDERAEQLCQYIRKNAQPSGVLASAELTDKDEEGLLWSGQAVHALLLHHKHAPDGWKLETARKALTAARGWWKDHKSVTFVAGYAGACAEAYLATKDKVFADFALEMCDWLCDLQYTRIEPKHMLWYGGFMSHHAGRTLETLPTIDSAAGAEALLAGCRGAREMGDVSHHQRYTEAVEPQPPVPGHAPVHGVRHSALREVVSTAARRRLPRFTGGRQSAHRLHPARCFRAGGLPRTCRTLKGVRSIPCAVSRWPRRAGTYIVKESQLPRDPGGMGGAPTQPDRIAPCPHPGGCS